MEAQAELEALRKEREEKARQIAEKRRQVEELKRRRAQRVAQQQAAAIASGAGDDRKPGATSDKGRSVDALVAEILGGGALEAAALQKITPAIGGGGGAGARPAAAARPGRQLQQEFRLGAVSVEPQENEVYDRSCQTDVTGDDTELAGGEPQPQMRATQSILAQAQKQMAASARHRSVRPDARAGRPEAGQDHHTHRRAPMEHQASGEDLKPPEEEKPEMSQEEKDRVVASPDFRSFFSRATLLVERTLGSQSWDTTVDWKTVGMSSADAESNHDALKYVDDYTEEKWAKGRPVTDVKFSPHQAPMFLAAYGEKTEAAATDPDGCMLVWNLAMKNRPELRFQSPSSVLTAQFHRFDQSLFYGGTYGGAVVMWDARARATPVLRTPLSGKGHAHPVQALQQVGTQNATNLVTASNDGRICIWSLSMLNTPQETIDLKNETKNRRELSIMSIAFPENETNVLYAGAEDGSVCQVQLHGSKVGVTEMYDGHDGPVAAVDMHPHQESASQHGLDTAIGVTCSFDWSVKVWMVKQYQSPVLSLDAFEDYVYDVKWHPTHPAVFASVDGEGHVDLWNLNQNIESPVVRCDPPENRRRLALNHCHWSLDGRRLAAGDSEGTVGVYSVDRRVAEPRNEDFQVFTDRCRSFQPLVQRSRDTYGSYSTDPRFAASKTSVDIGKRH